MKNLFVIVLCLVNTLVFAQSGGKSAKMDKPKSTISYHMVHPLHEWDGVNNNADGIVQLDPTTKQVTKVAVVAKLSGFDSKNSNRDSHMMEVAEGIKFPNVSFVSTKISYKGTQVAVAGNLTFHGVTKAINFIADQQAKGKATEFTGSFDVFLQDFGIEPPSIMMLPTENKFTVTFSVQFPI